MNQKQVVSQHGTVHYWICRHPDELAKCIVLTHGLTANHSMFEKQIDFLSEKYTVITWDMPLHGISRPYTDFSYENSAMELLSILENEKYSQAVLVGMSLGGYLCQVFGDMFPHMVLGFVALGTTPFGQKYYSDFDRWCIKNVAKMAACFPANTLRNSMAKSVSATEYSKNAMLQMLLPLTKGEIIEQMDIAYGLFLRENRTLSLSFPVLILVGDRDRTGKVKSYCTAWANDTDYPLHIIKNAAHFSNGDNPEAVNFEIDSFVQNICNEN